MDSMESHQSWKSFQRKLRSSGANSVYSAREMLAQEYVNQERTKQLDASGGAHELSPRHTSIDSSSANISSYSLSHSPPSDAPPLQQGRRSISISLPGAMQWVNKSSQETGCCTTGGFKSFVDDAVGRGQPESDGSGRVLARHPPSFSFDGLFLVRPNMTRSRRSLGSDLIPDPSSKGVTSSDGIDSLDGYQGYRRRDSVSSSSISSLCSTSERPSVISIQSEVWSSQDAIDTDEKAEVENSSVMLPCQRRRLSEPLSLYFKIQ